LVFSLGADFSFRIEVVTFRGHDLCKNTVSKLLLFGAMIYARIHMQNISLKVGAKLLIPS
jgi:hypothetical protein